MHPAPTSASEALTAANLGGPGSFQVTNEALLNARNILQTEYDRLRRLLRTYSNTLVVQNCGPDPVSPYASAGFNEKIGLIVQQAEAYVQSLRDATDQLDQTVRGYGTTDEQIKASFDAFQKTQAAPPLQMTQTSPVDPMSSLRQYAQTRAPNGQNPMTDHPAPGPAGGLR
ncbi:MAG TPA: hypothetical protein VGM60_23375 [Pseudonocardia sp.]|uniref:hypothetical protein n=1 Tax=Pseudonocardia sp. TaxID=60912 RepID=UPI002F40E419